MAKINLIGFIGEQPRVIPRLMPDTAARAAFNTRLDDGGLTPVRQSTVHADAATAACLTIYRHGDEWLSWEAVVDAAPGPVAQDRLYYTGDGPPKMRVDGDVYPLAVPRPAGPLTAALSGSGSGDIVTRIYAYTWVTSFGEESEPCPVSNPVDWEPGNTVVLSGFVAAPGGRGITHQRIYRSQTGQTGTYFYLIAERSTTAADFTDDIAVDAFQEPLPSAAWNAPPDDLAGLTALSNGMMAAFSGARLYFCEPYRPHAWPEKYVLTCDAPIVGVRGVGDAIVILTTRQPYMAAGAAPESMQMRKLEHNLPCINARGIVDLGYAIAYPSNEGLVVVRADGGFSLASANLFDRDRWQALSPQTMIGGQHQGRYVSFYRTSGPETKAGGLLVDLSGQSFLIRVEADATAAFFDVATGALFFLERDTTAIRRIDDPDALRAMQYWHSKEFVLPRPTNFGAIRIDADPSTESSQSEAAFVAATAQAIAKNGALIAAGPLGGALGGSTLGPLQVNGDILHPLPRRDNTTLDVGVYADGRRIASVRRPNEVVRLPDGFLARRWEVDVFGNVPVEQITVANTVDELKSPP